MPLFVTERGANTFELGIVISLLSFTIIATKIPLGILAEKFGRWPVLPAVAVGLAASFLLYSLAPNLTWIYPARILHAISLAAFAPTALGITQDLAPAGKRGEAMGIYLTSLGLATAIGPFFCTFIVGQASYAEVFRVTSIIPILGLVPLLIIIQNYSHRPSFRRTDSGPNLLRSLKAITSSRNMLVLTYLRTVHSFAHAIFITLFSLYAENTLLLFPSIISLLFGIKGITNMLSRIPSGKLADKVGYRGPILLAFILLAAAFLTISETHNIHLILLSMITYGAAHGIRAVTEWSMLGEYAPREAGSVATAYLSTMINVGSALGAMTAGALSIFFAIPSIFKIASVVVLSGAFIVNLMKS
jgi:predicted MFS family arabinose efflux permease